MTAFDSVRVCLGLSVCLFLFKVSLLSLIASTRPPSKDTSNNLRIISPLVNEWRLHGNIDSWSISFPPLPKIHSTCDCTTTMSSLNGMNNTTCCDRMVMRSHKLGHIWSRDMMIKIQQTLDQQNFTATTDSNDTSARSPLITLSSPKQRNVTLPPWPQNDVRVILLLRNIYSALVSGYLYHKSGMECWLASNGTLQSLQRQQKHDAVCCWRTFVSFPYPNEENTTSLCHLIQEQPVEIGMKAYIEWVMKRHYQQHEIFDQLALSVFVPWIGERTKIHCFEEFTSVPEYESELLWLEFFFSSTTLWRSHDDGTNASSSTAEYNGTHATSHDPELRQSLVNIIRQLDGQYFGGQIEWLNSVIPCK